MKHHFQHCFTRRDKDGNLVLALYRGEITDRKPGPDLEIELTDGMAAQIGYELSELSTVSNRCRQPNGSIVHDFVGDRCQHCDVTRD